MKYEQNSTVLEGASTNTLDYLHFQGFRPYQFTSPKDELLAARKTAWLGCYLSGSIGRLELWGSDAAKFLNQVFVNRDYSKLKIGGSRHALICNEIGQIMASGVINRLEVDYFQTYCLAPIITYYLDKTNLDVQYKYVDEYMYQIDGPKSLEILEKACECDLHDLKFGQNKSVQLCGTEMLVHRLGMSGALAYEVHGAPEHADIIYKAIREAGQEFGIKPLGVRNYCSNHTPGGYPNQYIHFGHPWSATDGTDEELAKYISHFGILPCELSGSAADNEQNYYVTPYDIGWGSLVNFDHDFPGKEALQMIAKNPKKTPVTLEWNLDDVAKIFVAEISGTVDAHEGIGDYRENLAEFLRLHADKVIFDGKMVGIASGRVFDYYSGNVISLAFIEKEYAVECKEVIVRWGKPGTDQMEIRAKVARFPYFNESFRNETYDVVANVPSRYNQDCLC